ncbi:TPA: YhcE family protein, partial [Escherichia coli]
LTLTMAPAFKDEGELTDMTDITGNLTVLVEAK